MTKKSAVSRRDFLRGAAVAGVGAATVGLAGCQTDAGAATPSTSGASELITIPPVPQWDYETDVVVLGYGFAGQGAALEASDAGASVIVCDKAPREHVGGSSAANKNWSSGTLGPDAEADFNYHVSLCGPTVTDMDAIRMHCEENQKLPEYFEKLGAQVNHYEDVIAYTMIPGGPEMLRPGTPNALQCLAPQSYIDENPNTPWQEWMIDLLEEREIPLMCNTAGKQLIRNPITGEILGVKCLTDLTFTKDFIEQGGTEIYIKANKGVVLATGGYEANPEMLINYSIHPKTSYVTMYGGPYQQGEGVTMAAEVGAKLWHMNKRETHMFACTPASKELGVGQGVSCWATNCSTHPTIIVNRDGKRFYNEFHFGNHSEQSRAWDIFEMKKEEADGYDYADYRNVPFFWIFDDTTMKDKVLGYDGRFMQVFGIYMWSEDNQAELDRGWFVSADTLEELANKIEIKDGYGRDIGMNAAGLAETVAKYNEYCAAGEDLDFGRRPDSMLPIVTPPFYAMELCECQTNTDGGPKRNGDCQVLDQNDQPIPRLYCAGELGSIYGHLYNGQQNIPEAQTSGMRAGRHAASLDSWD